MLLVAVLPACGSRFSPRSSSASATRGAFPKNPGPVGTPLVFAWDGVGRQILMSYLVHRNVSPVQVDPTTWVFTGTQWTTAGSAQAVPNRGILVYDSGRNRDVLFAGSSAMPASPPEGTWEWDGYSWEHRETAHSVGFLTQWASAAYSPDLRAIVMIDTNLSGTSSAGRTWLFDGTDWRSQTTSHWPDSLAHLEYDPARHSIVALSLSSYGFWTFDGRDWVPTMPDGVGSPAVRTGMGRQGPAAAFDLQRNRWIVFGGSDGEHAFADTWTSAGPSDGLTWRKESPIKVPPGRVGASMTWDATHHTVVLFGGGNGGLPKGSDFADTWSWDGNNWMQLAGPSYSAVIPSTSTATSPPTSWPLQSPTKSPASTV
jgi:hypothetical protein